MKKHSNFGPQTVAILFGGMGKEHDVSLMSAEFILSKIDREKFTPLPVLITKEGLWVLVNDANADEGKICYPARTRLGSGLMTETEFIPLLAAFPVLHGDFGEDGTVQGALECAGISYVGCRVTAGAISADKAYAKIVAEHLGVPTAPWVLGFKTPTPDYAAEVKKRAELSFGYPMFIKPAGLGSSIGAFKVVSEREFASAYLQAAQLQQRALVESALDVELEL